MKTVEPRAMYSDKMSRVNRISSNANYSGLHMAEEETIDFHGITFTQEAIHPADDRPIRVEELRSIVFRYGFLSNNPLFQLVFGIAMIAGAAYLASGFVRWTEEEGTLMVGFGMMALFLLMLGGWGVFDATRRGWFAQVSTQNQNSKVALKGVIREADIDQLASQLKELYGGVIRRE
jgi:hypothetical protein